MITTSNSPQFQGSGMPNHYAGDLLHTKAISGLSHVGTKLLQLLVIPPLRHVRYTRTVSLRAIATLAIRRSQRMAKCKNRRRQSGFVRMSRLNGNRFALRSSGKCLDRLTCLILNRSGVVLFSTMPSAKPVPGDANISLLCTIREDQRQKTRPPIWERIWERNQYLNALYVPLRSQNAC